MKISIKKIAIYLPKKTESNNILDRKFGFKKNTFSKITGIYKRKISSNNETAESMASKVARKLIKKIKNKSNITHIIAVSNTPSIIFPSISHYVHSSIKKFLKKNIFNITINSGCSGYVDALILASKFIYENKKNQVLIITSDTYSKFLSSDDKSTLPLFGDGASASLIVYDKSGWKIDIEKSHTIANTEEYLSCKISHKNRTIVMKGPELINFASKYVSPEITKLVQNKKKLTLFCHQASKIVLNLIKKDIIKINRNVTFPTYYKNIGNLVSSSIPILIFKYFKLFKLSKNILICGFGVGLTYSYISLKK